LLAALIAKEKPAKPVTPVSPVKVKANPKVRVVKAKK
jgi:hypothetical protein